MMGGLFVLCAAALALAAPCAAFSPLQAGAAPRALPVLSATLRTAGHPVTMAPDPARRAALHNAAECAVGLILSAGLASSAVADTSTPVAAASITVKQNVQPPASGCVCVCVCV